MKPAQLLGAAALLSFLLLSPPLTSRLSLASLRLLPFPASSPYAGRPKLLFLLAGRGAAPRPLPPPFSPHPRVLRLAASRRWVIAAPPLHADIDTHKACGLGPAMPFAHRVLDGFAEPVLGLVPAAVGGTRIWMWARGEPLYEAAADRARAAVDAGGGGTIGAVLWFQGESDTIELADATTYGGRMEQLVSDFRTDLGVPDLLVIQVGLASGEGNYTDIVREAQKNIKLPNVILADALGLPLRDDQLHLSTEAQLQLADMLAQAYLKFNSSTDSRQ